MTQEHITITEEVVKNGKVVTDNRVTLQTTPEPVAPPTGNPAYNPDHPQYISAQDRVYTFNEATGMSESRAREDVAEVEPEPEAEVEFTDSEVESAKSQPEICGHPIGNGTCALEANHSGQHRMYIY